MADISATDIQTLRQKAGVGMMDAKKALVESNGDADAAYALLRERGLAAASKRATRVAADGAVGFYLHYQSERPLMGVVVELACETDFVAKNPDFVEVANDLAMHIAWGKPDWIQRSDVPTEIMAEERDILTKQVQSEGKPADKVEMIVESKLSRFYRDRVLYDQIFVNTDKFEGTVEQYISALVAKMGENIKIAQMARVTVGETAAE